MFKNNKYTKIYNQLVENAKNRPLPKNIEKQCEFDQGKWGARVVKKVVPSS